jgi:hypothetical protein
MLKWRSCHSHEVTLRKFCSQRDHLPLLSNALFAYVDMLQPSFCPHKPAQPPRLPHGRKRVSSTVPLRGSCCMVGCVLWAVVTVVPSTRSMQILELHHEVEIHSHVEW